MGFVWFNFVFLISFFFPVSRIPCRAPAATVSRGPWHAWTSRGAPPSPLGCRTAPKPTLPKAPRLSSTSASQAPRPSWGTPRAPQAPSSRAPPRASASQQSPETGAPPTLGLRPPRLSTQPSNQVLDYWYVVIKLFRVSRVCSMSHNPWYCAIVFAPFFSKREKTTIWWLNVFVCDGNCCMGHSLHKC